MHRTDGHPGLEFILTDHYSQVKRPSVSCAVVLGKNVTATFDNSLAPFFHGSKVREVKERRVSLSFLLWLVYS